MKKENIFWALYHAKTGFFTGTELTRRDLIVGAVRNYRLTWKELRERGYSAKKVNLVEVKID